MIIRTVRRSGLYRIRNNDIIELVVHIISYIHVGIELHVQPICSRFGEPVSCEIESQPTTSNLTYSYLQVAGCFLQMQPIKTNGGSSSACVQLPVI